MPRKTIEERWERILDAVHKSLVLDSMKKSLVLKPAKGAPYLVMARRRHRTLQHVCVGRNICGNLELAAVHTWWPVAQRK